MIGLKKLIMHALKAGLSVTETDWQWEWNYSFFCQFLHYTVDYINEIVVQNRHYYTQRVPKRERNTTDRFDRLKIPAWK